MIRQMLAILVLVRLFTSITLILLEGASSFLQTAAFVIALIGLAVLAMVIGGMTSGRRGARIPLGGRRRRPLTAR